MCNSPLQSYDYLDFLCVASEQNASRLIRNLPGVIKGTILYPFGRKQLNPLSNPPLCLNSSITFLTVASKSLLLALVSWMRVMKIWYFSGETVSFTFLRYSFASVIVIPPVCAAACARAMANFDRRMKSTDFRNGAN